jgi:hypothetical protein
LVYGRKYCPGAVGEFRNGYLLHQCAHTQSAAPTPGVGDVPYFSGVRIIKLPRLDGSVVQQQSTTTGPTSTRLPSTSTADVTFLNDLH